jgi:UDP-N-acetylmuramoyl-tripeptide--D-alanyl-D-alanine ligase
MTEPLWTGAAIAEATGGRPVGAMPPSIGGVSIDTRSLEAGDVFFAIRGDRVDGHQYLRPAIAAGAALLVVSKEKLPALGALPVPLLVVDDVLKAMERLAIAARARAQARIVAVTGSVGKTTTKEALRHALGAEGSVHASAASFNNHWGVPLSLARLPADTRFAVFEIGMNHPDEIRPLVKLVRPHVAIVTLIAPAHLGHFENLRAITRAKGEIFEGLTAGGTAVINADDPESAALSQIARAAGVTRITTFGEAPGADYRLTGYAPLDEGSHATALIDGTAVEFQLPSGGRHLVQNTLAVLGASDLLGADVSLAAAALSSWRAGTGRGARHSLAIGSGQLTLIDESYNANPASMRAALGLLGSTRPGAGGRRIALLGDMLELGSFSRDLHEALAEPVMEAGCDLALLAGAEMRTLYLALRERGIEAQWFATAGELEESLSGHLRPGDVVMAKASKSIGFSRLVESLVARLGSPAATSDASPRPNSMAQDA